VFRKRRVHAARVYSGANSAMKRYAAAQEDAAPQCSRVVDARTGGRPEHFEAAVLLRIVGHPR
jgi:hypothetical protein